MLVGREMSSLLIVVKSHLFLRSPSPQCSSEPGERRGGGSHYQCALAEERGKVAAQPPSSGGLVPILYILHS